ncbi:MAG: hypothetical protein SNH28_00275 [Rikenellaceae bacterium]
MLPRILIVLSTLLGGCIAQHQSVVEHTPVMGWSSMIEVSMPNLDTSTRRDISIVFRYRPAWISEEVNIAIETIAPDSVSVTDTLRLNFERYLSHRGESELRSIRYRQNSVWRQEGNYRVIITPINNSSIDGVEAIGVNITPTEDITYK